MQTNVTPLWGLVSSMHVALLRVQKKQLILLLYSVQVTTVLNNELLSMATLTIR